MTKHFPRIITTRTLPSGAVETTIKAPSLTIVHTAPARLDGEDMRALYKFAGLGSPPPLTEDDPQCQT
jgi:hypothetical protein